MTSTAALPPQAQAEAGLRAAPPQVPARSAGVAALGVVAWAGALAACLMLLVGLLAAGWEVLPPAMLQAAGVLVLVAAVEPRQVLTLLAWSAPLFLAPPEVWAGTMLLDVGLLALLGAESARGLARALGAPRGARRSPDPAAGGAARFVTGALWATLLVTGAACVFPLLSWREAGRTLDYTLLHPAERFAAGPLLAFLDSSPGGAGVRTLLLLPATAGLVFFVAARCDARFLRGLLYSFGGGVALSLLLALAEYFGLLDLRPYRAGGVGLDFGLGRRRLLGLAQHPGWQAQLLVLVLPVAVPLWGEFHRRGRMAVAAGASLLIVAGLLTQQRAFLLAVAAMGGALALLPLAARTQNRGRRALPTRPDRTTTRLLAGAASMAVLLLLIAELTGGSPMRWLLATFLAPIDRLADLARAREALTAMPWGTGVGMAAHLPEVALAATNAPPIPGVEPIRSLWLMRAVEQGPLGFLALAALWGGALALAARLAITCDGGHTPAEDPRPLSLAVGLSLVGLLAYSLAHDVLRVRVVEFLFLSGVGALLALARDTRPTAAAAGAATAAAARREGSRAFGPRAAVLGLLAVAIGGQAVCQVQAACGHWWVGPRLRGAGIADVPPGASVAWLEPGGAEPASRLVISPVDPGDAVATPVERPDGDDATTGAAGGGAGDSDDDPGGPLRVVVLHAARGATAQQGRGLREAGAAPVRVVVRSAP